jgi:phosphatidylserine decarboxylase
MKKILSMFLLSISVLYAQKDETAFLDILRELNVKQQKSVARLYSKWYSSPLHYLLTRSAKSSRMMGRWANSPISRKYIPRFIKDYAINVDEIERPIYSFATFNEFFTRTLKPGARPLPDDPTAIISPADGSALVMQNINEHTLFPTKNLFFSARNMLNDDKLAAKFDGGTAIIIRLAPWDYHRVHFPLDGIASEPRVIAGRFESVSPAVFQAGIQPLEVNERHIMTYQTDKASTVALVLVGALFVGAIIETYTPGKKYKQGDELGYFEYGGSTMVMLFQKGAISVIPEIISDSKEGRETPVRMGQVIGHVIEKARKKR